MTEMMLSGMSEISFTNWMPFMNKMYEVMGKYFQYQIQLMDVYFCLVYF